MRTPMIGLLRQGSLKRVLRTARYRCEYWGMRCLAGGIPLLSRAWALRLAKVGGWVAYWVDARGRSLAMENLSLAIKHGHLDLRGRNPKEVVLACYGNFSRNFIDLFWYANLSPEQVRQWAEVEGGDEIADLAKADSGAIYLTPHYGSFELASLVVGYLGLPLNIVAQEFRNSPLTDVFRRARESSGHSIHSRSGVMLKLFRMLRDGKRVAMLPDLSVPPQGAATLIQLFGIPASVTSLHVELAKRCSVPIIAAVCEPCENGKSRLRILEVFDPPAEELQCGSLLKRCEMTQRIWDCFAKVIHRRPELWLWMYRHWRYRPPETDAMSSQRAEALVGDTPEYPSYAMPSVEFGRRSQEQSPPGELNAGGIERGGN